MKKDNIRPSVLVVEDDDAIVTLLQYTLEKQGYEVRITDDGEEAIWMVEERKPDLVLLDWMLPGLTGIEVCNRLRRNEQTSKIPIIMISARGEEGDKIEGLDRGADDYLVKPFSPKELVSRINAVFRRIRPSFVAKVLSCGSIKMDLVHKSVTCGNREVHLGPTEYRLLQALLEHPKRVLSREQLIRRVWQSETNVEPRTIDVHVNRLRKALKSESTGTVIRTLRSSGYCIKNANDTDENIISVKDSDILSFDDAGNEGF